MHASREDPRFDGRRVLSGAHNGRAVDSTMKAGQQPAPFAVRAHDSRQGGTGAQGGNVVGCVPGTSGHDPGRVVLEDEDRRLA